MVDRKWLILITYSLAFLLLGDVHKEVGHVLRRLGWPGLLRVAVIASLGLSLFA
jgi:hypothetical protein